MFQSHITAPYMFILLRHGESTGNAENRHQGIKDYPLTETGLRQSQLLAERWQAESIKLDRIFSSPLQRARQTAEILSTALSVPIEFDPIWVERDVGLISGLKPEEAEERHPRKPFMTPYQPIGVTGESQWSLFLRAGRALEKLVAQPPGNYLVVSHGGILNMVMYAILGLTPYTNQRGPRFRFGNTTFASLTYTPSEHAWRILGVNDQQHLIREKGMEAAQAKASPEGKHEPGVEGKNNASSERSKDSTQFGVRLAAKNDLDGMVAVWEEAEELHRSALPNIFKQAGLEHDRSYLANLVEDQNSCVLIAVTPDQEVIGVLHGVLRDAAPISILAPRCYALINNLVVKKTYHRAGVGQALMEAAHAWAAERGATEVELNVWEFNQGAIAFYERLGYSTASRKMWKKIGKS